MSTDFVHINTLFPEIPRDLAHLSEVYDDEEMLYEQIKKITAVHFTNSFISAKKILLKPNWVKHNRNTNDELCLTTNFNFILALVKLISELCPLKITIGDAPIQGCDWNQLLPENFLEKINIISKASNIPIFIKDFRRVKYDPSKNLVQNNLIELDDFVIFDLAQNSYLEPITDDGINKFRVTQYDPDRFMESHRPGMHKYCITKEIFDADIIISLPKLKTHQKAGITAALKNIVGINGDKDFLPHHRVGGTEAGGDSYPGKNAIRRLAEYFYDKSYKTQGSKWFKFWTRLGSLAWILSFPGQDDQHGAAWHGNDTVWRMVMDLNKIITFGKFDGTIHNNPVRVLYSLGDGIIGGQGDGPLNPDPLPLGVITFTNNSAWHDICVSELMQFEHEKIALLRAGKEFTRSLQVNIVLNNRPIPISYLKPVSIKTIPPPGWINFFNS